MPAKNRAFDNNNDLDDMFGEGELLSGDQGAPPASQQRRRMGKAASGN